MREMSEVYFKLLVPARVVNNEEGKQRWLLCSSRLGLVWFYSMLIILGYLMPNLIYTYILSIYNMVWLSFMEYQPL